MARSPGAGHTQGHRVLVDGALVVAGSTVGANRIHLVGVQRTSQLEIELDGTEARLRTLSVHRTGVTAVEQVPEGYVAPTDAPDH